MSTTQLPTRSSRPHFHAGTEASVFAVYDDKQKLQYIGFSKDLRSTLRTVLGRRPDRAFFYKAQHFSSADQKAMVALRDAWFEECGGQPPGNKRAFVNFDALSCVAALVDAL